MGMRSRVRGAEPGAPSKTVGAPFGSRRQRGRKTEKCKKAPRRRAAVTPSLRSTVCFPPAR